MQHDRPLLGIALMLGFCLLAPLGDAIAKLIGNSLPIAEIVLIRFALQAVLLFPLVKACGLGWRMSGRVLWLTLVRTILHIIGIAAMFTAPIYLPLADAVAIVFVMPFFILILGRFFLNEQVGTRRVLACLVGFVGTLLVIQPSFVTIGWPALLPVFVAATFAAFMLVTRQIAKQTDPIALQAISGSMAVIILLPTIATGYAFSLAPMDIVAPTSAQWPLLIGLGVIGTLAHLLMTWSLRFAQSATLAPMQYLEIPIATLLGLVIFNDLPNLLACVGIAITIAAGLYIILSERATALRLPRRVPRRALA